MKKLFLIVLIFPFLSQHAFSQWELQPPLTSKYLSEVKFVDQQTGWIVGSEVFLRTHDGGNNWIKQDLPDYHLDDFYFVNDTLGWLVGYKRSGSSIHGLRMKTSDGGKSFTVIDSSQAGYFESVYFIDENNGWIVGGQGLWPDTLGLILQTIDGGTTWARVDSEKISDLRDVNFIDNSTGFAVGEHGYIYKSQDGGSTWRLITQAIFGVFAAPLRQVYFTSPDSGWVAGGIGGNRVIGKTVDGGETWQFDRLWNSAPLHGLSFINSRIGWVVGNYGTIFQTSDFGNSWVIQQQIVVDQRPPILESIFMVKENEGWIVGEDGLILKYKGDITNIESSFEVTPSDFKLFQNYPNPFNPTTTISFQLPEQSEVTIKVFNLLGREVATLLDEIKPAGLHKIEFNASELTSGIYFYQLRAGDYIETRKFILLE